MGGKGCRHQRQGRERVRTRQVARPASAVVPVQARVVLACARKQAQTRAMFLCLKTAAPPPPHAGPWPLRGSEWSRQLFEMEMRDLLTDLKNVPKNAAVRKVRPTWRLAVAVAVAVAGTLCLASCALSPLDAGERAREARSVGQGSRIHRGLFEERDAFHVRQGEGAGQVDGQSGGALPQ
eukprot:scaffold7401_cov108-Isochrysis_galbana.AAC.1